MTRRLLFGLLISFLFIKLFFLLRNDYDDVWWLFYTDESFLVSNLKHLFFLRAIFLDTILVVLALTGTIIRGQIGLILCLIYPYTLLTHAVIFVFDFETWDSNEFGLYISYFLIVLTNLRPVQEIFNTNKKQQMLINVYSLTIGICIMIISTLIRNVNYLR
jgi:hypothetical protein